MKIVIYRPYSEIWFKNQTSRIISDTKLPNKYEGLFDYLTNSQASIYLSTGLIYGPGIRGLIDSLRDALRLIVWCLVNRINLRKIKPVFSKNGLRDKDVLYLMYYGNFTDEQEATAKQGRVLATELAGIPIHKVVHMTHFAYNANIGSENLAILKPDLLVAENNLFANSPFYKKYFSHITSNFLCLPYTPAARFTRNVSFDSRTNKLVVTGSITYKMRDKEFVDFYGLDELQPMRRVIFQKCSLYPEQIVSLIYDWDATRIQDKTVQKNKLSSLIRRKLTLVRWIGRMAKILPAQRGYNSYYSMNIVDVYNSYTMFAVPEEVCNLPAIGFIEGMACGAAYVGLDDPMYRDIGMIPGEHYIAYDGSMDDLVAKIDYYQKRRSELEAIASKGYEFAHSRMNPQVVYGELLNELTSINKDTQPA